MSPKDFYLSPEASLEELTFKEEELVGEGVLRQGSIWGLPEGNLCGFKAAMGLFDHAKQRLSDDGEWILIASLAGSVKVPASGVDLDKPVGLVCVHGGDWRERQSSVSKIGGQWAPMTERALGEMQASRADGHWLPLAVSLVTRGFDGTSYEHQVILPCLPESVVRRGGKAILKCEGEIFVLEEPLQVQAALDGTAAWILPNEHGDFVFPGC